MFFKTKYSRCVHASANCERSRVKDAVEVEFSPSFRKCKFCWPTEIGSCLVCFEPGEIICPCRHGHSVCHSCLSSYVDIQTENPEWDGIVRCPCNEGKAIPNRLIPSHIREKVARYSKHNVDRHYVKQCYIQYIVEHILSTKCPHCSSVFSDFTGCLSLLCRCNKHFCALCLQPYSTNEACHEHVLNECVYNPLRGHDYFINLKTYDAVQHDRKCYKIWTFLLHTVRPETSSLHAFSILLLLVSQYQGAGCPHLIYKHRKVTKFGLLTYICVCIYLQVTLINMFTIPIVCIFHYVISYQVALKFLGMKNYLCALFHAYMPFKPFFHRLV